MTLGMLPSGKVADGDTGRTSSRGLARRSPMYSVNSAVEVLQRRVLQRVALAAADGAGAATEQRRAELVVVGLGHAEQVGDHQHRERAAELSLYSALAVREELRRTAGRPASR